MSNQGTVRARGKRPRPSDASDVEKQPTVVRRKDGMASVVTTGLGERNDGSAYRKGMYLAFIDDAFAKRSKVSPALARSEGRPRLEPLVWPRSRAPARC